MIWDDPGPCKRCGCDEYFVANISRIDDSPLPDKVAMCKRCRLYPPVKMYKPKKEDEMTMTMFPTDEQRIKDLEEAAARGEKWAAVADLFGKALEDFRSQFVELEEKTAALAGVERDPVSVADWCRASHEVSRSKGWYDDETGDSFATKMILVHSELSEVIEEYRNGKGMNEIYYSDKGKPEGIPIEMADVLIRIFDLCEYFGIPLQEALKIKHAFNKTRPHRHGGKKI